MPVPSMHHPHLLAWFLATALCLGAHEVEAGDASKISPLVSLTSMSADQEFSALQQPRKDSFTPYPSLGHSNFSDHDLFSLALGARIQISDWLGIGATCTMPLTREEEIKSEDLSIEAMVTMQF